MVDHVSHFEERWNGEPTTNAELNKAREFCDWLYDRIVPLMGGTAGVLTCTIAAPLKIEVYSGTIWSFGFWQAADSGWWLLGRQANVSSFTRGQANFYIPLNDIADVPSS